MYELEDAHGIDAMYRRIFLKTDTTNSGMKRLTQQAQ